MRHRLLVFTAPVLLFGLLQLSGCASDKNTPPAGGIYRSTSAGAQFDQAPDVTDSSGKIISYNSEIPLGKIYRPAHAPDKVYVIAGGNGILISTNNGETWQRMAQPLSRTMSITELSNQVILISGVNSNNEGVIIRSLDKGKSWERVLTMPTPRKEKTRFYEIIKPPPPSPVYISSIRSDPHVPDRVYATTNTGEVLIGNNSGKTWRSRLRITTSKPDPLTGKSDVPVKTVIPSPHNKDELLVITSEGKLVLSKTEGEQENISLPSSVIDATYVQGSPGFILVGTPTGAYVIDLKDPKQPRSARELKVPLSKAAPLRNVVVVTSPTNPSRIMISANSILFRSEDSGQTWNALSLNLPNHIIVGISIDPHNAANVLIATTPVET